VTGAGRGIGRGIALALAERNWAVVVNYRSNAEAANEAVQMIQQHGGEAVAIQANVGELDTHPGFIAEVIDTYGRIDLLVNNAGMVLITDEVKSRMAQAAGEMGSAAEPVVIGATSGMTDSQWRRTLSVHLDGTFYCTREALGVMEAKRSGKIINIASIAGTTGLMGSPDYSAAKAGIIGFTKAVAREAIRSGVHVNAIAPGFIDTPLLDVMDDATKQRTVLQIPMGRLGTVTEVAALALYLAGADSSYMVGQVVSPNGGYAI
jgi:3-oxoacyl-[acyl-carrier protein] reductase